MAVSARGVEAGRAYLRLLLDSSQAESELNRFEGVLKARAAAIARVGSQIAGLGAVFTLPLAGAVRAASNAQETFSKFDAVLGKQTRAAREFVKAFSAASGQSLVAATDTFATLFSQLSGAGVPAAEARREVERLTAAIADFESFSNLSPGEGLAKFQSALAGEVEPLRRFGIELSASRIDDQLRSQGKAAGAAASGLDKLRARTTLLLSDLERLGVLGDLERTAGGLANQGRALTAVIENLSVAVGSALVPSLELLTPILIGAAKAVADGAERFPILSQAAAVSAVGMLAFGTSATVIGLSIARIVPYLRAGAAGMVAFVTAGAGLVSVATAGLGAAVIALTAGIVLIDRANADAAESTDRLSDAYERYAERTREAAKVDVASRFQESEAAAASLAEKINKLAEARRELNALENAGRGDSAAAANLRGRLPGLQEQVDSQTKATAELATAADPFVVSERFRSAPDRLRAEIAELDAQIAATDPSRQNAVAILQSKKIGKQRALADLSTGADPAIALIQEALTNQVAGGTAADPEKRLVELKGTIDRFQSLYRGLGDATQANRFGELAKRAAGTVPSRIGGRSAPLLAGDPEAQAELRREAEQRADLYRQSEKAVAEARDSLLETTHQRQLARIRREHEEQLALARSRGSGQEVFDNIGERTRLATELADRQEAERKEREEKSAADRTRRLRLQARAAEIAANPNLTDFQKGIATSALQVRDDLADGELTDEQRALVQRAAAANRQLALATEIDRQVQIERDQRQQALSLDVADLFTGNPATALSIGPPASIAGEQLREQRLTREATEELRDAVRQAEGGIRGG